MSGFPLDKAKEAMRLAVEQLHSNDTFNIFSFADKTERLFAKSVRSTPKNRATALHHLDTMEASGGTEMLPALREALESPTDPPRVRSLVRSRTMKQSLLKACFGERPPPELTWQKLRTLSSLSHDYRKQLLLQKLVRTEDAFL